MTLLVTATVSNEPTLSSPGRCTGFYQPVDMNGVYNRVKGGSTVPLKFEIFAGTTELTDVAYVNSFSTYGTIACDAGAPIDDIETVATGGTSPAI